MDRKCEGVVEKKRKKKILLINIDNRLKDNLEGKLNYIFYRKVTIDLSQFNLIFNQV